MSINVLSPIRIEWNEEDVSVRDRCEEGNGKERINSIRCGRGHSAPVSAGVEIAPLILGDFN